MILQTKKRFFRKAFFAFLVMGTLGLVVFGAVRRADEETTAISQSGQWVKIIFNPEEKIHYGETPNMEGWDSQGNPNRGTTHHFWTQPNPESSVVRYTSYCANPSKKPLDGTYRVLRLSDNAEKYQLIKMAIFAGTKGGVNPTAAARTAANALYNKIFADSGAATYFANAGLPDNDDIRYAYIHAVIGALYTNGSDYAGLKGHRQLVDNIIAILSAEKSNNTDAYVIAQSYSIYRVDREEPQSYPSGIDPATYDPDEYQDIVWIESSESGGFNIEKKDKDTNGGPQGNGNFADIRFEVRAVGRIYRASDGAFFNDNDIVATGTTDAQGKVSFSDLPLGTYKVVEPAGNSYYDAAVPQTATIYYEGYVKDLTFYDTVKKGSITVEKVDADSHDCRSLGSASLTSVTFSIVNRSAHPVIYGGSTIPVGSQLTTGTISAGRCNIAFNNLPYGTYEIIETAVGTGYSKTDSQTVTIPRDNNANITVTMANQVYRGNIKFKKVDQNDNNSPMANVAFKITSSKGESHIVVTNSNGEVDTSAIDHNRNTNNYDTITNPGDYVYHSDWGTWFYGAASVPDHATIDNTRGALPYDTYTLTEVSCPTNEFCYDVGDWSLSFTISENKTAPIDLGNLGGNTGAIKNDCVHHEIATTATDPVDGDKYILVGEEVTVRDRVAYHAMRGKSYTVRGTLYDAETGLPLNSTQSKSFSIPENGSEDGYVDLDFTFDSTEYAGHSIVVFEELVYDNRVVAEHKELTDEKQTVYVIDFGTTAVDDADGDKYITNEENMTIEDTIDYCLVAHQSFRFVAHLYDKTTGRLLVNGNGDVIEYSLDVTPETACGAAVIELGFNAKGLEGHHIVVFEKLYHEDDLIMTHEDKEDEDQTVYVIGFGTTAVDQEDRDKYVIDGDLVTIRDRIRYCLVADRTFTVSAYLVDKATGQPIEGGEGEIVSRTYTFVPNTDCGSFVATFKVNASKLAGHDLVAFERVLDDGKVVLTHEDIEDQNETVRVISLQTFATSNQDEIDELDEDSEIVITDLVKYCLKANNEFTFVGKLYDKDSGQQLVIDGTPVEQSYTFTPKKDCGEFELTYKFPAKGMAKKEFVILEELYDDFGRRILLREDLDNEDETVHLPDTGYMIKADGGVDGGSNPAVIALLGVLVTAAFVIVRGFTKTIIGTRKAF